MRSSERRGVCWQISLQQWQCIRATISVSGLTGLAHSWTMSALRMRTLLLTFLYKHARTGTHKHTHRHTLRHQCAHAAPVHFLEWALLSSLFPSFFHSFHFTFLCVLHCPSPLCLECVLKTTSLTKHTNGTYLYKAVYCLRFRLCLSFPKRCPNIFYKSHLSLAVKQLNQLLW